MTEHIDKLEHLQSLLLVTSPRIRARCVLDVAHSVPAYLCTRASVERPLCESKMIDSTRSQNEVGPFAETIAGSAAATVQQVLRAAGDNSVATDAAAALEAVQSLPEAELKAEVVRILSQKVRAANGDNAERNQPRRLLGNAVRPFTDNGSLQDDVDAVGDRMRIPLDKLCFHRRIGEGSAGTTYEASWEGTLVAVKVAAGGEVNSWRTEVRALTQLRHPNIIQCLGVLVEPPTYGLVLELCDGRDLSSALGAATPPGFLLRVASGVTAGMMHMHGQGIMHRDLKGSNVLLDQAGAVKLTDFGLAIDAPDCTASGGWLTAETGTLRWMAPEVIRHERYSKKADVFSFGMVLYELLTHDVPFPDRPALQAAVAVALN